jgi:hypothetical protein
VPPPTTPTLPEDIASALDALAAAFPDNCELITLPNKSADPPGVDIKCVRLHEGNVLKDPAVLIIGGVHGREWAPPDALLRLAQNLLDAYKNASAIEFPPLTAQVDLPAPNPPLAIGYPAFRIPYDHVLKIFKGLDLYILPCVNPDGRQWDILTPADPFPDGWRKNRRNNPDNPAAAAVGVDLNRNFDIAWDFARYFDMVSYRTKFPKGPAVPQDTAQTFNGVTDPARTVAIKGGPTGGSLTLSFNGADTALIPFNAAASVIQDQLTALATIGSGNVTVTGPDGGPYAVTFTGARAHPVAMLTASYSGPSGLVGGDNPHVEIRHAGPTGEPETLNVQWLVDNRKVRFFLDVHSAGRTILVPWGLEDNGDDPSMSFLQASWDWQRDGLLPADVPPPRKNYNEYVPNDFPYHLGQKLTEIAGAMQTAILRASGADPAAAPGTDDRKDHSTYTVGFSSRFYLPRHGGPTTGSSDDYAFSRQFVDTSRSPIYAFTTEVGADEEGIFHPDYMAPANQYQKIEREVHAAVDGFLMAAANWGRWCLIATAAYGSETHPDVVFLRTLRDDELCSTRLGRRVVAALERIYYTFSPATARYLIGRPTACRLVRTIVVHPVVIILRLLARASAPIRPRGLRVGTLTVVITALIVVVAVSAVACVAVASLALSRF